MERFHAGNLHQIKDVLPGCSATASRGDAMTISELARSAFISST